MPEQPPTQTEAPLSNTRLLEVALEAAQTAAATIRDAEPHVAQALEGLRGHVEVLRVLGSFVAA